ncbi:MAG: CBS domain-containing protein [Pseudomonadota bacterium]
MDQPISSLIEGDVISVDSEDTIDKVEHILRTHNVTYVPVIETDGRIFGIITARDMINFHSSHKSAKVVRAWEICTHKTVEVSPHKSVHMVAQLMVEHKIHHVLVSDEGVLKGVISSFDLVEKYLLRGMVVA